MILALDPATTVGWAAGVPGQQPQWGSRLFEGKSTGQVIGLFRHWLNQRCYELHPRLIVFEAPYVPRPNSNVPMNVKTLRRLLALAGQIEACAWELRIECREATALDIARFFLGTQRLPKGAKKAATIEMCRRYGWVVDDDNQADALALWHYAESVTEPDVGLRRGAGPLFAPENRAPPIVPDRGALLVPNKDAGEASDGRLI